MLHIHPERGYPEFFSARVRRAKVGENLAAAGNRVGAKRFLVGSRVAVKRPLETALEGIPVSQTGA